jgi:hypothetical protein
MRPAGLETIMARVAAVRQGSPRVQELRARFGLTMQQALGDAGGTGKATDGGADEAAVAGATGSFMAGGRTTSPSPPVTVPGTYGMIAVSLPPSAGGSARATEPVLPLIGATAPADGTTPAAPSSPAGPASGAWQARLIPAGRQWADQIGAAAARHGLDPAFLAAVVWTESSFQPGAVSPAGAIGLGQLMPGTARELGVDPWDPVQNLEGSARFYRQLIDRFGSERLAAAAYFSGPGAVARAGGVPTERSQAYVDRVLGRRDYLSGARATAP